jgi:excisionase family DNA binding protein
VSSAIPPSAVGDKHLLVVAEVANLLRVSERTVRRMIADGTIPVVRIGRSVRIRRKPLSKLTGEEF